MIDFKNNIPLPSSYQYIGCILVAVTSLLVILLYFNRDINKLKHEPSVNTPGDVIQHACVLAKEEKSYLQYLKKLDKHISINFPPHCRTIDFYLACKEDNSINEISSNELENEAEKVDDSLHSVDIAVDDSTNLASS